MAGGEIDSDAVRRPRSPNTGEDDSDEAGLDPALLDSNDFVLVHMPLVDVVGLDAAIVMQRISWRCELRPHGWPATLDDIGREVRLSRRRVQAATQKLRARGYLRAWREDPWLGTLTWLPLFSSPDLAPPPEVQVGGTERADLGRPSSSRLHSPPIDNSDDYQTGAESRSIDAGALRSMFGMPGADA